MAVNINRVVVSGNLTRDPELRSTGGGTSVCNLGLAVNERRKQGDDWVEVPNFFKITVWGKQGEAVHQYLKKGSGVMIDGKLRWSKYTDKEGNNRESVEIVADSVQFMPKGGGGNDGAGQQQEQPSYDPTPADTSDWGTVPASTDDIPF